MEYLLLSNKMPHKMRQALEKFGNVVALPDLPSLPEPIRSHPDTLFASVGGSLFTYPDYADGIALLKELNIDFLTVASPAGERYPQDAALNCFEYQNVLFGRRKSLAPEILKKAAAVADVNQGYAHCATATLPCGLISSDGGIISKAASLGEKTLKISPGGVALDGYSCGFIGGACVGIDGTAVFFGDPRFHPDGKKIIDFISSSGMDILPLDDSPLADYGGILAI